MSVSPNPPPPVSPGAIPSGTVTFAFTDIEGSTQRWERDREAMENAVRRHDALMRSAITTHNGHVFKTIGDAFCAAFSRPEAAVAAIVAAQRALAAEDFSAVDGIRIRAAIHTGTSDERDGDYYGPAVNRVARLLPIGHGGQTLVSGVTQELVRDLMPDGTALHDLGRHRLKDLVQPEHVYQVSGPDLASEFQPLRSLDVLANNLPRQVTPLVGREREVAEICALLDAAPLVTLVGSGGVGKTRVSLQLAANLVDGSGDGVWFIELAPISDASLLPLTIASAAGLKLLEHQPPLRALVEQLATRRMLFVLDNCEHVVADVATIANEILRRCPGVKLIATSRESLGIHGETIYRMESLDVPPDGENAASAVLGYSAVELFVTRAKVALRTFDIIDANAGTLAEIVRRLDGIPFAIELAAARLNFLSPEQLLDRLDDRLRILTGGDRTRMPRQQTLRALIDWSYDLLSEPERAIFRALGTFVGGWTLETATALAADDFGEWEVLDVLGSLVAKSLVVADVEEGASSRYRLLESTRQYARERQKDLEEAAKFARRHCDVFRTIVVKLDDRLLRAAHWHAATGLLPELDNLRAAISFALGPDGDEHSAAEIVAAGNHVWIQSTARAEVIALAETALERLVCDATSAGSVARAKLELALSHLYILYRRDVDALEYAERARDAFIELGDRARLCIANLRLAEAMSRLSRFEEADALVREAVDIARDERMPLYLGRGHRQQGSIAFMRGDLEKARTAFADARGVTPQGEDPMVDTELQRHIAELEFASGNVVAAIETIEELVAFDRLQTSIMLWNDLMNLAAYRLAANDRAGARASATESLSLLAPEMPLVFYAVLIEHVAVLAALEGALEDAAVLLGYSSGVIAARSIPRESTEQIGFERLTVLLEGLNPDIRTKLFAEGASLDRQVAIARAKAVLAGGSPAKPAG